MNNDNNGFIAWEDVTIMQVVGKFPDYTVMSGWHQTEKRDLTEQECEFISEYYDDGVQEFVYTHARG